MALLTLSEAKAFLNITDTSEDVWLTALLRASDQIIKSYCGLEFERATYTEFLSGNFTKELVLRETPVISVTSVHLDNEGHFGQGPSTPFGVDTLLTEGEDYSLVFDGIADGVDASLSGILYRINTIWSPPSRRYVPGKTYPERAAARGNVKVVYVGGYTDIPEDLKLASSLLVSRLKLTSPLGGQPLRSERIGEYSYELFHKRNSEIDDVPDLATVRQILSKYKDVII